MATGLVVSSLPAYVEQSSREFLSLAVLGGKSKSMALPYTGVKGQEAIQIASKNLTYQSDACKLSADGTTVLTQKILTVGKIAILEEYCMKDLLNKWTQTLLRAGSNAELGENELNQMIVDLLTSKIKEQEEINIWQGDTAGSGNVSKYDGWLKLIDAEITANTITAGSFVVGKTYTIVTAGTTNFTSIGAADSNVGTTFVASGVGTGTGTALDVALAPVNGNPTRITTATGITTANIIGILQGMYKLVPATILEKADLAFMCGMDTFRTLQIALTNANLFHYTGEAGADMVMTFPGTNMKVYGLAGLNSTNRILATYWDNLITGTDLQSDEDTIEVWVDPKPSNKVIEVSARFKAGAQIGFGQEIVQFKLV